MSANLDATLEIYGDSGGVPGNPIPSHAVRDLPGGELGTLSSARPWQHRFDFPPLQLNAGRAWVSV